MDFIACCRFAGSLIIKGYTGSEEAVRIPEEIAGEEVVWIERMENSQIKYIELPDEAITFGSFEGCDALTLTYQGGTYNCSKFNEVWETGDDTHKSELGRYYSFLRNAGVNY